MTTDQFAKLKPPAIISTIASLPRRFGEAFVPAPTADPDEVGALVGADGRSMLDLVASATATVGLLHEAVTNSGTEVPAATIDASKRASAAANGTRTVELANLEAATDAFAAALKELSGKDWGRTVSVAGGGSATIEELGQEAVRSAIAALNAAEDLAKTF